MEGGRGEGGRSEEGGSEKGIEGGGGGGGGRGIKREWDVGREGERRREGGGRKK